ncbi:hypothetical protein ACSBR1_018216 [Camellia fascicularis]
MRFFIMRQIAKCNALCHLFEFKGILCRYAISVLIRKKVNEVPSRYILERWRKNIKRGYTALKSVCDDGKDEQRQHNKKLTPLLFEVQQLGMESKTKCELLMKLLHEAKEKLLKVDSIHKSSQSTQVLTVAIVENDSELQEIPSLCKRLLSPLKVQTKGCPPSERRESTLENIAKKAKKEVCQGNTKEQPNQRNSHL